MNDVDTSKECAGSSVRRYVLEILGATVIFCAVVVAAMMWLKLRRPHAPWKYVIAGLPVLPALLYPTTVLRLFRNLDELQQKMQLESLAFAFTGTAVLTLAYGLMESAGLPRMSWSYIWPLMAVLWTIGLAVAHARYK